MSKKIEWLCLRGAMVSKALAVALCLAWLTGCSSIPAHEFENFVPLTAAKRVMNQPKISWEVRDDVVAYCARAKGMGQEQAYMTPPLACAIWNTPKNECTLVTGKQVNHVALGHEVRHCFEGHFH
jgi:hypothetical protein